MGLISVARIVARIVVRIVAKIVARIVARIGLRLLHRPAYLKPCAGSPAGCSRMALAGRLPGVLAIGWRFRRIGTVTAALLAKLRQMFLQHLLKR